MHKVYLLNVRWRAGTEDWYPFGNKEEAELVTKELCIELLKEAEEEIPESFNELIEAAINSSGHDIHFKELEYQ